MVAPNYRALPKNGLNRAVRVCGMALSGEFGVSDINSDLVAQEVDDEVRRERMNLLWKRYGKYVIGGAVGVVLVVAGREIYNWRVSSIESQHSEAFQAAIEQANVEGADAVAIWREAAPKLGGGYVALAQLREAAALADGGDIAGAIATYDGLAADDTAPTSLRELGTLKASMLMIGQGDLDSARGKLSTIAVKGKAWYFSAQEQLALIDLQQGDLDGALEKFRLLAEDAETPASIQGRASQFRTFIEAQQFATDVFSGGADSAPATDEVPAETQNNAASEGDSQ